MGENSQTNFKKSDNILNNFLLDLNKKDLDRFFFSKERGNKIALTVSALGLLLFILISISLPFNHKLFNALYPKKPSFAMNKTSLKLESPKIAYLNEEFEVKILLNTYSQTANYFSAELEFSKDTLGALKISTKNSIITRVDESIINNQLGTVVVKGEGKISNYYDKDPGLIATISFKAKAKGSAKINIKNRSGVYRSFDNLNILTDVDAKSTSIY